MMQVLLQQFMEVGRECLAQAPEAGREGPGLFIVILPNIARGIYAAVKRWVLVRPVLD